MRLAPLQPGSSAFLDLAFAGPIHHRSDRFELGPDQRRLSWAGQSERVALVDAGVLGLEEVAVEPIDAGAKAPSQTAVSRDAGLAPARADEADRPFGPNAAQFLSTEHWSLLATRSLIWTEALSRATVFLTVLSATIISLALLADATGFGPETTTVALVLLPIVFLLGLAAYARLVQINTEEFQLVLAMNRVRHAYLQLEPGLEPYFTTGHHDDERGVVTTYMFDRPSPLWLWIHFVVNTPTIIATVDAAVAATVIVLLLHLAGAPMAGVVGAAALTFLAIWTALFLLQWRVLRRLFDQTPRFVTPEDR